jgi:CO/xanthine dehydrogenase FAD-binding subunit
VTFLEGHQIQRSYDYLSDAAMTLRAVQQTGTDLVQTVRLALAALNTVPVFIVPAQRLTDNRELRSYAIAAVCESVLQRATGESPYSG